MSNKHATCAGGLLIAVSNLREMGPEGQVPGHSLHVQHIGFKPTHSELDVGFCGCCHGCTLLRLLISPCVSPVYFLLLLIQIIDVMLVEVGFDFLCSGSGAKLSSMLPDASKPVLVVKTVVDIVVILMPLAQSE